MLILELGDIVDILVNDDPWGVVLGVGGNILLAEGLRHGDRGEGKGKDKAKVGIKMNLNGREKKAGEGGRIRGEGGAKKKKKEATPG